MAICNGRQGSLTLVLRLGQRGCASDQLEIHPTVLHTAERTLRANGVPLERAGFLLERIALDDHQALQQLILREGELYLRRHFLSRHNESPQVWLHEILRSDTEADPHDHPWDYVSVLLSGCYEEENSDGVRTRFDVGTVLARRAEHLHRLHLVDGPVTTLFITKRKRRAWGFMTSTGWVHASTYLAKGTG